MPQYALEDRRPQSPLRPLLITVYQGESGPDLVLFRLLAWVAVFLATEKGEIEADLLRRLEGLGVLYQGVVDREKFGAGGAPPPGAAGLSGAAPQRRRAAPGGAG